MTEEKFPVFLQYTNVKTPPVFYWYNSETNAAILPLKRR